MSTPHSEKSPYNEMADDSPGTDGFYEMTDPSYAQTGFGTEEKSDLNRLGTSVQLRGLLNLFGDDYMTALEYKN